MDTITVWMKIDEDRVLGSLQEASEKLDSADGEVMLDFSSVRRMDSSGLKAAEQFATAAEQKKVKVVLRGVAPEVFKVLRLVNLSSRFSFVN
jgi:anti-anti-sigma regulatory factor